VVGDIDSALAGYYAEQVEAVAHETPVSEWSIREWFDRHLITDEGFRGQVLQTHGISKGLANQAIRSLVDAHLVRAEVRRGATWFELAHDRLIEPVQANNAAWRRACLSALRRQAARWEISDRASSPTLGDQALIEAAHWAETHPDEVTRIDRDFLAACRMVHTITQGGQRQIHPIYYVLFAGLVIITMALFCIGVVQCSSVKLTL
jgi:hypothetical protein